MSLLLRNDFVPADPARSRRRPAAVLLAIALLCAASCGRRGTDTVFPVQGKVFYKGRPAHKALVWLHPLDPLAAKGVPPRAVVEEDGSFQVSTYQKNDGAPVGHYRITISWKLVKAADEEGPELLPPRYQDPDKSGLPNVEVKDRPTELPPFQLTD
jgi:hypothetical protein